MNEFFLKATVLSELQAVREAMLSVLSDSLWLLLLNVFPFCFTNQSSAWALHTQVYKVKNKLITMLFKDAQTEMDTSRQPNI